MSGKTTPPPLDLRFASSCDLFLQVAAMVDPHSNFALYYSCL